MKIMFKSATESFADAYSVERFIHFNGPERASEPVPETALTPDQITARQDLGRRLLDAAIVSLGVVDEGGEVVLQTQRNGMVAEEAIYTNLSFEDLGFQSGDVESVRLWLQEILAQQEETRMALGGIKRPMVVADPDAARIVDRRTADPDAAVIGNPDQVVVAPTDPNAAPLIPLVLPSETDPENFAADIDVEALNAAFPDDIEERVVGVDYDALGNTYLVNLNGEAPLIIPATEVGTLEALTAAIYDNLGMDEGEAAEVVAAATAPTLEAIGAAYAAAANKGGILTQVNDAMGYVRGTADRITRFAQIQDRLAADPALRMAFGAALGLTSEAPVVANPDPAEADPVASETAPAEGLNAESVEVTASYDIKASEREVVRGAQNLLNRAGFNAGGADGLVGPRTLGALRNAQEAAGLDPESTIVTPALVAFLNNKIQQAERATYVAREIEQNRSDRDFIRSVQMLIKPADAPDSWADGSWGRLSRAALNEADVSVLDAVQALVETQAVTAHLEAARQALGAERAAEIDALIENGASIDELAALTSPDATGGMENRNLVAQYLQAKYEADGTDFSELAVAIMAQYECPEDWTVRQALHPAQNGNDEAYFRQFRRNGRESYYRIGYRVKQNELVQAVENSVASLTVAEAYNEENNTITIGDQVVALPSNARLHMTTGNEAGRADGWMDMTLLQAGNFELSHVVYDEPSGAIYFTMNNGCHGNPGVITVEQGLIPLPPAPRPGVTPDPEVDPEPDPELHTREECHNGNWSLRQWRGPFGPVTWTTLIPNDPRCNIGGGGGGGSKNDSDAPSGRN